MSALKPMESSFLPPLVRSDLDDSIQELAYNGKLDTLKRRFDEGLASPTSVDSEGRSLLHWAAAGGRQELVEYLLRLPGVAEQVNKKDDANWTPVTSAAAAGSGPCLTALLDAGGNANIPTETGTLPLHYHKGRKHILELLIPVTKSIDAVDSLGHTALHKAASAGYSEAAQMLLSAGADANIRDKSKCTALMLAQEQGRHAIVKLLVENGATS